MNVAVLFDKYVAVRLGKKHLFVNSKILGFRFGGEKNPWITKNLKLWQNSVNQIFNPNAFFFFFLTVAICYYYDIYIVLKYFASFTGNKVTFLKLFIIQRWQKYLQIWQKIQKKLNCAEAMEFVFSKSGGSYIQQICGSYIQQVCGNYFRPNLTVISTNYVAVNYSFLTVGSWDPGSKKEQKN